MDPVDPVASTDAGDAGASAELARAARRALRAHVALVARVVEGRARLTGVDAVDGDWRPGAVHDAAALGVGSASACGGAWLAVPLEGSDAMLCARRGDGEGWDAADVELARLLAAGAAARLRPTGRIGAAVTAGTLDALPETFFTLDGDWRLTFINAHAAARSPVPAGDLLGRSVWEVFPALLGTEYQAAYERARREQRPVSFTACAAYSTRWYDMHVVPAGDGIAVYARDVTALKESETRLLDAAERYRQIFEYSPRPMWVYELASLRFLAVNDAAVRQYGWSREEFLRMTLRDIRPPSELAAFEHTIATMSSGYSPSGPRVHRRRDGSLVDVEISSHSLVFEGHEARLVLVTDVTTEKRAREALHASEARFRAIFDQAAVGIILVDDDGTVMETNGVFQALVGYGADELRGVPTLVLSPADDAPLTREAVRAIRAGERTSVTIEKRYLRRDGETVWVMLTISPLALADGTTGLLGVVQDVTERRQLEQQLLHAQKLEAIGQLAGGVAHDFNNVLAAISGNAELLEDTIGADDPRREDVQEIRAAAARGAALTRQLLAFSRKQPTRAALVDGGEVVRAFEPFLRRLLGTDVRVVTRIGDGDLRLHADRGRLEQVVMNLAVNGRDAMPGGGELRVEIEAVTLPADALPPAHPPLAPGGYVRLAVRDHGVGMDERTRARAFEPFFTTKEPGKGTGLGLSTVWGIARDASGGVVIESAPGAGTAVLVYLPRDAGAPA